MTGYYKSHRYKWIAILFIPAIFLGLGWLVMILWNAILPDVLHTGRLVYWQALALLVLTRILFGSFRYGPWARRHPSPLYREKWMNMTEEERQKFREEWKKRCS